MSKLFKAGIFLLIAIAGAAAFARIAVSRGETLNAAWLLTAAVCTYAIAYRFYSKMIAAKVFALDKNRPTPAVRLEDGRDFVPTNRWIVFGHHFAAIAGPGPLVGPTLAAQFGYLPGIIAHCRWPLHTSVLEGVNNKIKVIKRMAFGFRDDAYFFLKIRAAFPGHGR